ncbi:MAG: long-chain fatty acid--CoA ligase [Ktedonobacterales bacterium]
MSDLHFAYWPERVPRTLTVPETTLYYNLEVAATRYPAKTAIAYYGQELSYSELLDQVNLMSGYLRRLGVLQGDRVLLYMHNCPQFIVAYYAILRANAVVVPLNALNVTNELRYYAQDSQASIAFTSQDLYPQLAPLVLEGALRRIIVAAYSDYAGDSIEIAIPEVVSERRRRIDDAGVTLWADALSENLAPGLLVATAGDLALLVYTSGTTGEPKGCMHTHRSAMANVVGGAVWTRGTSESVVLATLPLFHVTGMQGSMNAPIYLGSTTVLMTRWNRDTAAYLIQRYGCTGWTNISTMMVDFLANPRIGEYDLHTLEAIGGGGAPLPAAIGGQLLEMTGLHYVEGYGLSETMAQSHINPSDRPKLQCLGIPVFDMDARVIDPGTLEELGPNQDGEIILSGPQVFKGYWNRPEDTRQAFVTLDGKQFFRTGDLGHFDDEGYFFHVDRLKRMINASGFKVWPAEVETLLYKHPAVQEACVIGIPDARRGESVKALIILREAYRGRTTPEEIIEWSKAEMAAYKYPRYVEFVDTLPHSGSGKVLWRLLSEEHRQRSEGPSVDHDS